MTTQNESGNIILDSIADGVFTVDGQFRITYMNRAAEDILGIRRDEAMGKICYEVFHASICEHSCALRETMETGRNVINRTIFIVNADGRRIPVSISTALLRDERGAIIGGAETFRDISEVEELRKTIESKYTFEDIVSKNKKMMEVFSILPDIAESGSSVIIEGASGTGKELVARALHNLSPRKGGPLVVINCAALPENLLESELFGYKAGAFTDARRDKPGKIAAAEGGSLFLDEVGEISSATQAKLLRFLEDRTYEPLGSVTPLKADVRIIAATNKNLREEVGRGAFREDLYYRLNVVTLRLPTLDERKEDIPLLVRHFVQKYNLLKGKEIEGVSDDVMNELLRSRFPGNVRELENIIEHAFVLCKESHIQVKHLPVEPAPSGTDKAGAVTLEEMERDFILKSLEKNRWNRARTARDLGIDGSTLWRKMKKFGISEREIT